MAPSAARRRGTWPQPERVARHDRGRTPQARVVHAIAHTLRARLDEQGLSLRQTTALTGVNRLAIVNLLSGISRPDVVTVSLLEDGLGVAVWLGAESPATAEC
ncbi:helix-turn-helix domain-containing protein [Streptomyces sp. NPDC057654]|uniref:helix-turn-helix domain-containing protein n=1 Tax=Streptomyces sp. NPDC057654 TaxID=3346196 RepID=UPI003676A6A9